MNVASMRRIDRWIGAPMCAVLTLVRRLDDLVLRRKPGKPERIAIIKLAEQGATVVAYDALTAARDRVGADNLFFVVFSQNRFILDLLHVVPEENVLEIRAKNAFTTAIDVVRVVWRMHRERIDTALDFEFFARSSAILTYLSGARNRVGFHAFAGEASYRGDLMTHRLSFNPFLHAGHVFRLVVEALRFPPERLPAVDWIPPEHGPLPEHRPEADEVAKVRAIMDDVLGGVDARHVVLLNANCSDMVPLRRWPRERYVELARRLLDRYPDLAVMFTGAPEEAQQAGELVSEVGERRCVSIAGKTTLAQLVVLYGLADLLVTNDSGPAHFASLTPIDIVVLFGPETPEVFRPLGPRCNVLYAGTACSPCINAFNDRQSSCPDNVCMQEITLDQVFDLSCRVFDARRAMTPATSHGS
ncbi:MAG: glycosyltransferase family 9 protein [Acidobacteriota bacterium]|nr:glycosyltransferase family 9 protein [Acidobacteriota bacterium]